MDADAGRLALALRKCRRYLGIANVTTSQSVSTARAGRAALATHVCHGNPLSMPPTRIAEGDVRLNEAYGAVQATRGAGRSGASSARTAVFAARQWMLLELAGSGEARPVRALYREAGYLDVVTCRD